MTNSAPQDPQPPRSRELRRDEQLAVMVALSAIGAIIWWALKQSPSSLELFNFDGSSELSSTTTPKPSPTDGLSSTAPGAPIGEVSPVPLTPELSDITTVPADPENSRVGGVVPVPVPLPTGDGASKVETVPSKADVTPLPEPQIPINPNLPDPNPKERIAFVDVPAGYWALPFIDGLSERKVVAGVEGKQTNGEPIVYYEPERPISRAEFAAQLQRVFALPERQKAKQFTDISGDYWAAPAIIDSNKGGYMNGYPEGNFRPDRQIPRLEMLVALATGLQLPLPPNPDEILQVYEDAAQIPNWAKPKIAAATSAGLVAGHPNPKLFNPNLAATRAEVAATLYQALVAGKEAQPIESEYLVKPKP